jgi:hypothetical protein
LNPEKEKPGKGMSMGMPVLHGEKMMGVKGKIDGSRFMSSEVLPQAYLPGWKPITRRILAWLGVMMDGLYYRELLNHFEIPAECDPCRYWKRCPMKLGREPRSGGKTEDPRNGNFLRCPIFIWLGKII